MRRMEMIVHMAMKIARPVEPGAGPDKDPAVEPLRPVITVGSTIIRRDIVVAVRADRLGSDVDADADLSLRLGCCC